MNTKYAKDKCFLDLMELEGIRKRVNMQKLYISHTKNKAKQKTVFKLMKQELRDNF